LFRDDAATPGLSTGRIKFSYRLAILSALLACGIALIVSPRAVHAFAGQTNGGGCAQLIDTPQKFARLEDGTITYRLSENFKVRYPDAFSQYLVRDVMRWWQDYISGFLWTDDIHDRFSYYREFPDRDIYELKSVLAHEAGHAVGMQHSDACYYNINGATGDPWESNYRSAGGGGLTVAPTVGPELMNEGWTVSSPGEKSPKIIRGYNRTPGLDGFEFVNYAYPFQSLTFEETTSSSQDILFDSTDTDSSGGQTTPSGHTQIDDDDVNQGWYIGNANVWIGNDIGIEDHTGYWQIENFTGFDIRQITLRVNGTSTRRAISENAPPFFTFFGAGLTSSPEQLIFDWSTPFAGPWPPSASGWLNLTLDVHDWVVQEALMWANSNQAFPLAIPSVVSSKPWGLASPSAPPPGQAPAYSIAFDAPSEPTPEPDDIELLPPEDSLVPNGLRGFTLVLPQVDGILIDRLELVALDWPAAELLERRSAQQRIDDLSRRLAAAGPNVVDLIASILGSRARQVSPYDLGLRVDPSLFTDPRDSAVGQPALAPLSMTVPVPLDDDSTYAVRVVLSTPEARVTALFMPEMNTYQGTRRARCAQSADAASCCPVEMAGPIQIIDRRWSAKGLTEPHCIIGGDRGETIQLDGGLAHVLASGAGDDHVVAISGGSVVMLGRGDDHYTSNPGAVAHTEGGPGKDTIVGSNLADDLAGDADADTIIAKAGNDRAMGGAGDDYINAGPGDDEIYPGSGNNAVDAGPGDDWVIYTHACELAGASRLNGGPGFDTLVLPVKRSDPQVAGLSYRGFESVVEEAGRSSVFADCE
jgi:hypothetical protein